MAYLLIRQIFKKNQDIVYVVPNFDMADQVWNYIERFIRDINDPGLRFDKARRTFSYTTNRSICTFVSADSKSMGRSKKADLALYDE
jgi:phage terminase large subunit-like protein